MFGFQWWGFNLMGEYWFLLHQIRHAGSLSPGALSAFTFRSEAIPSQLCLQAWEGPLSVGCGVSKGWGNALGVDH
jgi:hypothetical protein